MKAIIDYNTKPFTYYDINGEKIEAGDMISINNSNPTKVYLLDDEKTLGIDSTNPAWIKAGRAVPCEFGCYPLNIEDLEQCVKCNNSEN